MNFIRPLYFIIKILMTAEKCKKKNKNKKQKKNNKKKTIHISTGSAALLNERIF